MSEKPVGLNPLHVYIMAPFCSGLTAAAVLCLVDIMSLSPSKHSTCKQGTSTGKAIPPLGPHLSFPIHTALCTHLNDKPVCTQIHYEHLGTE